MLKKVEIFPLNLIGIRVGRPSNSVTYTQLFRGCQDPRREWLWDSGEASTAVITEMGSQLCQEASGLLAFSGSPSLGNTISVVNLMS